MKYIFKNTTTFLFRVILIVLFSMPFYAKSDTLYVGQSMTCDASTAVLGLTADVSWSTSGGYISLDGAGFYRKATITKYFPGSATITCKWKYKLYSSGNYTTTSKSWTVSCRNNTLSISPTTKKIKVGETFTILTSHNNSTYNNYADYTVNCSDPNIVFVNQDRTVTGRTIGKCEVYVYSSLSSDYRTCAVEVTDEDTGEVGDIGTGNSEERDDDENNEAQIVINLINGRYVNYKVSEVRSIEFQEKSNVLKHKGHEYIDLGLKDANGNVIYWATCNVGASKPEEPGLYFAWGETKGYLGDASDGRNFVIETYKYYSTDGKISKYNTTDKKTELDQNDDAAFQNWGGSWRTPTLEEFDQLVNYCTWTWTELNGVKGYKVSNEEDINKFIFLPAAGWRVTKNPAQVGDHGCYWSSIIYEKVELSGQCLDFRSNEYSTFYLWNRYIGFSVRPVCVLAR